MAFGHVGGDGMAVLLAVGESVSCAAMTTTLPVLIIGAGPTGLMLANQLGRRGVQVRIIDRHRGPAQQTRAMAVHARTLEIYRKLGIVDEALGLGRRGNGANMWSQGRWRARVPLEEMGKDLSAYPYVLMLGQDDNERIMGSKLRDWDLDVEWNTELIALEQAPEHVVATVLDPNGESRRITAKYVAGCDGAHSAVRELNAIAFPGAPYEHVFFVADTEAVGPMIDAELNVYLWRDGFHLFFPMRGRDRWRVIGILPRHLSDRNDLTFEELSPAIRREAGAALTFKACDWFSTYRIHHRCTERFRDRRCFLLGDAAHVHSPMGGQGMNTGLQDAYNLAWKLELVLAERAAEALLDSYEAERLRVARALLNSTDRAFRLLVSDRWIAGVFRAHVFVDLVARAMKLARARRFAFRAISQIGISYRSSVLSRNLAGLPADAPRAGERFPWVQLRFAAHAPREDLFGKLDDLRFNLLIFGQPGVDLALPEPTLERLDVHAIPGGADNDAELSRARIPHRSHFLLRPDGHIGLAGTDLDVAALQRWFADAGIHGLPPPAHRDPARAAGELR
jgi:2-polyprenyl-6-methoxyphenol hydroxylase-like FAD-dependent oxidoreductase